MVIRFYYRFTKSGCAFFTKKHVYMGNPDGPKHSARPWLLRTLPVNRV